MDRSTISPNSFFIVQSSKLDVERALFYRKLNTSLEIVRRGRFLIDAAEHYYLARDHDKATVVTAELQQLPFGQFKIVGDCFEGLLEQQSDLNKAEKLLTGVADNRSTPLPFLARSLFILGSVAEYRGDYTTEQKFYSEALKLASKDCFTFLETQRAIAISESRNGNHEGAINILENTVAYADSFCVHPILRRDHRNSLAIELCYAGRLDEAESLSRVVISSKQANLPQWTETLSEIQTKKSERRKRRSMITVSGPRLSEPPDQAPAKPAIEIENPPPWDSKETGELHLISEFIQKKKAGVSGDFKKKRASIMDMLYRYADLLPTMTLDQVITLLSREIGIPEEVMG